jgi:hypothetical protein
MAETFKVGITGSYGGLNLGDEAILQSIITQLRRDLPQVPITVFSRDAGHENATASARRASAQSRARCCRDLSPRPAVHHRGGVLFEPDARMRVLAKGEQCR